jgi:hypothetical protein
MNILHQSQLPEPTRSPAPNQSYISLPYDPGNSVEAANSEDLLIDLSLEENGKVCERYQVALIRLIPMLQICYYGLTSAVHDLPVLDAQLSTNQQYSNSTSKGDVRTMLTSNAMNLEPGKSLL